MKFLTLIILVHFSILSYSQTFSDDILGLDSLWNTSSGSINLNHLKNNNNVNLYITGSFNYVNDLLVNGVSMYNGVNFKNYHAGVAVGGGRAMTVFKDTIYIGGTFTSAGGVANTENFAVWNGYNWQTTNVGRVNGNVRDMVIFNDTLYICGDFTQIGSSTFDKVAAYCNGDWRNIGSMGMWTSALEVFNGELYAGGYYGVRKYTGGTNWVPFDVNPDYVFELKTDTINTFFELGIY